jgi:outer membrane protein OmpA-like peptidoglycan-associated protein
LRAFFEPRFGRDLSGVRLQTDAAAAASARDFGARAYAWDRHIAFGPGQYRPDTGAGRRLIAHEIAHVAQQGRAPMRGAATAQAPPRLQRTCGPDEIGFVTGCSPAAGDIFGTPILFDTNCDTLTPEGEFVLAEIGELVRGATIDVHGFASEEGDPRFNDHLSCLRARTVANQLMALHGATINRTYQHGPVPGEREPRRSACVEIATPAPGPTPVPVPGPVPAPAPGPAPAPCNTLHNWAASALNVDENVFTELLECQCELMKIGDILNSVIGKLPKTAARIIEAGDCLCGAWDWLQLFWEAGSKHAPCWDPRTIDKATWARLIGFGGLLFVDCFVDVGDNLVNKVVTWVETKAAEGSAAKLDPVAFLLSIGLAELVKWAVESWGEAAVDLASYLSQNMLTHGTAFPIDGCRSCFRLPFYFGGPDLSWLCDSINAALPDMITQPAWHGEPTDCGWSGWPNTGGVND